MNMLNQLKRILEESGLSQLFEVKEENDRTSFPNPHVAYRVQFNLYRIRAFELWGDVNVFEFRIYHGSKLNPILKERLMEVPGAKNSTNRKIDYKTNDYVALAKMIKEILLEEEIVKVCKTTSDVAKISQFEGLVLKDIDVTDATVLGRPLDWSQIIAIFEDNSEENVLKEELSKGGVYLQRSKDGASRYVGSAYGGGGILGRWMKHLTSNGNAHHLNLFVLENGYNAIEFLVLELLDDGADIMQREVMWKKTLATVNRGPYNSIQLNRN
ncbi:hypothetical protein CSV65_07815 [Sporosarcina sp. P31]|nr:hypothetical protein CSV66_07815 [Sporosarcina sp. P30]PID09083.1 hypothetical protein CSV65_07815 [Sporosarcina sp. P31]PID12380.1 hypothetical protein CSV64_07285 [Sporosarcina sp. P32b]